MIGNYVPGSSLLHRVGAGGKILATLALMTVLGIYPRWWLVTAAVALLVVAYPLARLPLRALVRTLRVVLIFAVVLAAVQVWWQGPARAVEIVGQLVVAVLAGNLVMMTTKVSDMVRTISVVAVPLQRWGVRRDQVELVLSLTIGCIPRVARAMTTAREAARARGVKPRLRVIVPSVVVALVREADQIGEAIVARGL
ncbi:energy-coupling factor transporter transmembrane component T family protein [Demetria terragena]|uniref:energy-coupling factor transporter transmembrane component T family protein n=1 Tax=Demetria terragena TaxID=63959 RepID=UPI000382B57B|nr:energy-coupling factor transporter transmembrane protein EcfT [Demetria terragena]